MEAVICFGGVCVVWSLYYASQHWRCSEVVGVGKMTDLANTMKGFVCSFPMRGGAFCACLLPPARPSAVQQSAFQERWGLPLLLLLRHVVCGGYYCLSICRQELASIYDYYYYHNCVKNRSSRYGNAASKVGMVFFFTTILLTPSEVLSHIVASSSPQHTASSTYADLTTNDVSGVAPTTWAGTTTASEIHALSGSQHAPTTLSRRRWLAGEGAEGSELCCLGSELKGATEIAQRGPTTEPKNKRRLTDATDLEAGDTINNDDSKRCCRLPDRIILPAAISTGLGLIGSMLFVESFGIGLFVDKSDYIAKWMTVAGLLCWVLAFVILIGIIVVLERSCPPFPSLRASLRNGCVNP
eukprot:GHVS01069126.1.p1 GENE.GHVS01069126.1~~GHVS01069126.1.p1  ORF type:complete len:355 (-),score=42.72 GHVS01069126.1:323-1387(-)